MSSVIIDDEPDARKVLATLLAKYCPDVSLAGQADNVSQGCDLIREANPDLVFLDVEINGGTGFDILRQIPERRFDTVFVSAFNHYSLKAIKFSAIDFLVKPVDASELAEAVTKVRYNRQSKGGTMHDYNILLDNLTAPKLKKIALPDSEGLEYVAINDLLYIKAEGSYTEVHLQNGEKRTLSKNLREFTDKLGSEGFYRVHNSYLINTSHIKKYLRRDGGVVVMSNKAEVPVSRSYHDSFREYLKVYSIRL